MKANEQSSESLVLHPELRAKDDPDAIVRNGRRLDHAEASSKTLRIAPEQQPRGANIRGDRPVNQAEAAARFIASPKHEKLHDERLCGPATGSVVVCTNEGNADMSANVPKLHIASITIEKIIPRLEHLAVFVRLLSRSALGSLITQYTSHFRGAREGGEMHIVLVDNGRSERLGLPEFWTSLKCIRCGACMNTCPVCRRSGGLSYVATYSGPISLIIDPTFNAHKYSNLPFASTLNGSCTNVCPVKINIHEQELADVDFAIVRAAFGVAETGSVLLSARELHVNAVAYLAQHLIVLLDPSDIVINLHHAYRRQEFRDQHYACFHTAPSATADIEGVLIHGAQGVRSLSIHEQSLSQLELRSNTTMNKPVTARPTAAVAAPTALPFGQKLLEDMVLNKDTAFSAEERQRHGVEGSYPLQSRASIGSSNE